MHAVSPEGFKENPLKFLYISLHILRKTTLHDFFCSFFTHHADEGLEHPVNPEVEPVKGLQLILGGSGASVVEAASGIFFQDHIHFLGRRWRSHGGDITATRQGGKLIETVMIKTRWMGFFHDVFIIPRSTSWDMKSCV